MECTEQIEQNVPQTTLLSLNDYCLLKVFEYLYIVDVISLGDTCKTLQRVSTMAATKYKHFDNVDYKRYCRYSEKPVEIKKIFSYIAPNIESLQFSEWKTFKENECKLCLIKQKFIKLKSLSICSANILKYITACNVENLEIDAVRHSDLSNLTYGMTTLKKLKFSSVSTSVSNEEFKQFVEQNTQLEQLSFSTTLPVQLEAVNFSKLRNLQLLHFHVDKIVHNLGYLLQIEKLTALKIEFNQTFESFYSLRNTLLVQEFLHSLAQKKTLKSLELRSMNFNNDQIFDILSLLNLVSLRISCPRSSTNICGKLTSTSFPTLIDLDIVTTLNETDTLNLIANLESLERLTVFQLEKYNSPKFLHQLNQLLRTNTRVRPDLELNNQMESSIVKIRFNLRCYEITTTTKAIENKEIHRKMFEEPRRHTIGHIPHFNCVGWGVGNPTPKRNKFSRF